MDPQSSSVNHQFSQRAWEQTYFDMARAKRATLKEPSDGAKDPIRRPRSAPSTLHKADKVTAIRKRAQSEMAVDAAREEGIQARVEALVGKRASKRLRGMAPSPISTPSKLDSGEKGNEEMVEDSERMGLSPFKRRKFQRTTSSSSESSIGSRSTTPEGDPNEDMTTEYINLPSTQAANIRNLRFPEKSTQTKIAPTSIPPPDKRDEESVGDDENDDLEEMLDEFPPAVLIDGEPSVRIIFRNLCIWRRPALSPPHEWPGCYFLSQIQSRQDRLKWQEELVDPGYIVIPDSVFADVTEEDESSLVQVMNIFFERYSLPKQPLSNFSLFQNPTTRFLEPKRLLWWKALTEYFHTKDDMSEIYRAPPGTWHEVFHALPTFSDLIEFSEVTEKLAGDRAKEIVHLELARRLARFKGGGHVGWSAQFELLQLGYQALRDAAKQFGARTTKTCSMCCVQPPFRGTLNIYST